MGNHVITHQRTDGSHLGAVGHVVTVDVDDVESGDGIVHHDTGVTQQEERQLVGVAGGKAQLALLVGLAQCRHLAGGGMAEHAVDEVAVEQVITRGIYHARRGEHRNRATVTLVEHQLGDTARVTIEVGNVTAGRRHDGPVAVGRARHVTGGPHLVRLGKRHLTGMAYIGGIVHTVLEHIREHVVGLGGRLAVNAIGEFCRRTRVHDIVDRGHVHTRLQLVVDHLLVTLALEGVQGGVGTLRLVADDQRVVAPHAVVGRCIVLDELVNDALGLGLIGSGNAAHADGQAVGRQVGTGVVLQEAEEVVARIGEVLIVTVVALGGEKAARVFAHGAAVVKQQQVLELGRVAVIHHLAQQPVGHGVAGTARELVEHLVLVNDEHVHTIDSGMQVGHALSLVTETLVRDNEHLGNGQTMQVLVVNRLKTGDFLQRLVRLKGHIVGHSRRSHEEVAARTGIVGVVCSTDLHGVLGIVDAPYHHIARGIGQQVALVALGHGKAHVQLVAILLADVIVVLVGQDKVVQTGHQHVCTGRAESQHRLKLAMLGGVTELE